MTLNDYKQVRYLLTVLLTRVEDDIIQHGDGRVWGQRNNNGLPVGENRQLRNDILAMQGRLDELESTLLEIVDPNPLTALERIYLLTLIDGEAPVGVANILPDNTQLLTSTDGISAGDTLIYKHAVKGHEGLDRGQEYRVETAHDGMVSLQGVDGLYHIAVFALSE
jgi:hypothetical protein